MKNKILISVLLMITRINLCTGQSDSNTIQLSGSHRKSVFVEVLGDGVGFSANFDMRIKADRNYGFGLKAGLGVIPEGFDEYLTLPLGINYIIGKRKSGFESGLGVTTFYNLNPSNENYFYELDANERHAKITAIGILNVAYRYQTNSLMFRVSNSLMYVGKGIFFPPFWPGVSVGYNFGYHYQDLPRVKKQKTLTPVLNGKYRKAFFAEFAGNGLTLLSANFDMRLKPDRNDGWGFRAGAGIFGSYVTLPLAINYIVGKRKSGFESGIGITPIYNSDPDNDSPGFTTTEILTAGYRFQPVNNGISFRVNWSVDYYWDSDYDKKKLGVFLPGLSVGYSFK